jgi:putative phage-type endonuclease
MEYKTYINNSDLDDVINELPECVVSKKVLRLLFKRQVKQRSEDWYVTRKSCLTASDAATALGINPYKKPAALIKSKAGFFDNVPPDPAMIRATEHGIKYEDEAAAAYAVLRPDLAPFFELGLIMHEKHPFLGASPDRITKDGILIEIKAPIPIC